MPDYPDITVAIISYNRQAILAQAVALLDEFLNYAGHIRYLVSEDGDVELTRRVLSETFGERLDIRVVGDGTRLGLGGNENRALRECQTEIVLQSQDDYFLEKHLDLNPHVRKLLEDQRAGWIRFRCIGGHQLVASLEGSYWKISWGSPELYIVSDQPHLKKKAFHEYFGYYPENRVIAETENAWCHQAKDVAREQGALYDVLVPIDWPTESSWSHQANGDLSWQPKGL
jgi:glycosyltransferase involved in cell wall biosynthesis